MLRVLTASLQFLSERIDLLDREVARRAREDKEVRRLTTIPGVGPVIATAFRKDNGPAIRATCKQFVMLCRRLELFSEALVAIDGSKVQGD